MRKATILIADDERLIRWSLAERLSAEGYGTLEAESGRQTLARFDDTVDLVLLDYRLGDTDGLRVLEALRRRDPDVLVIVLTAYSNVETAVAVMKQGAYHYVTKPFNLDEVSVLVGKALEEKTFKRVGGAADIGVDVRIIAATNQDLEAKARGGAFREDRWSTESRGSACPEGIQQVVRATWAGGVRLPNGDEPGDAERALYRVTVERPDGSSDEIVPAALADLGDRDNNHLLCLDTSAPAVSVSFPGGHLVDPNRDLNPDTHVAVNSASSGVP